MNNAHYNRYRIQFDYIKLALFHAKPSEKRKHCLYVWYCCNRLIGMPTRWCSFFSFYRNWSAFDLFRVVWLVQLSVATEAHAPYIFKYKRKSQCHINCLQDSFAHQMHAFCVCYTQFIDFMSLSICIDHFTLNAFFGRSTRMMIYGNFWNFEFVVFDNLIGSILYPNYNGMIRIKHMFCEENAFFFSIFHRHNLSTLLKLPI